MASRDGENWPMVSGMLRGADVEPFGPAGWLGGLAAALGGIPFVAAIIGVLVEIYLGRDAQFLYTYNVGGKYYTGKYRKLVGRVKEGPKLFGRSRGEAILVRYNPEEPEVSTVREEDNLPRGAMRPVA
jgi:hypothetical protein